MAVGAAEQVVQGALASPALEHFWAPSKSRPAGFVFQILPAPPAGAAAHLKRSLDVGVALGLLVVTAPCWPWSRFWSGSTPPAPSCCDRSA